MGRKADDALSVRSISVITFSAVMLASIGIIAYLALAAWMHSADQIMRYMADELNRDTRQRIDMFVKSSEGVSRYSGDLLEHGTPDLSDEVERDRFFTSALGAHGDEIFSFAFCTSDGALYGAKKASDGGMRILRRDSSTGGILRQYMVQADLTAGEALKGGQIHDPRTLTWYKAAVDTGAPAFSPIHLDYAVNQLMVSASRPIYGSAGDLKGVLVADILLSDLGANLEETVSGNDAYAFIVEKDTGLLVANSLGLDNHSVSRSGSLRRYAIDELDVPGIAESFRQFSVGSDAEYFLRSGDLNLHVNAREYKRAGLNWVILTIIPEPYLMAEVDRNIWRTALLVVVAILVSMLIYYGITSRLLRPMNNLILVAEHIASGRLSERAVVARNDEIGRISMAFNQMADEMQYLINNLEDLVRLKTADLEASKDQLRLLLDSTAEAIYGVDTDGNCTFCNKNCLELLGYDREEDLLGRNMHETIHHTKANGTPFPISECGIVQSIRIGIGRYADDEVFWRSDGTRFFAEYHAHPQMRDGVVIGAVISFLDITERKKRDEEILYLSSHDVLTGLYNRWHFQQAMKQIDDPENLPLSVIFADLNGLKMTNDIFGHAAGDALIVKASEILVASCREADMIARVGGDEFVILLPGTDRGRALKIIDRIRGDLAGARVAAVKCSISLGCDTRTSLETSLEEMVANAENAMYKDKTLNRKSINEGMIDAIMETLHEKSPKEKRHSVGVSELCGRIGAAMKLPVADVKKMREAGYLHDIGKITLEEHVLYWDGLAEEEREKIRQHSAVGYRILTLFDNTLDLAEGVYSHHERWDGTGYPKGLKGDDIPLLSRVISVAETYERVLSGEDSSEPGGRDKALKIIREGAGRQFDPQIADLLVRLIEQEA